MPRLSRTAALLAILVVPICSLAHAQDPGQYQGYHAYQAPIHVGPVHGGMSNAWGSMGTSVPGQQGYLDAPLYPCPRPDIPREVGGTMITNPALDPHEMLYAHRYRAMYGPYYYKNCGFFPGLGCTRYQKVCGMDAYNGGGRLPHNVKLIGTEVRVKYHSHYTLFSGFFAPKTWGDGCH